MALVKSQAEIIKRLEAREKELFEEVKQLKAINKNQQEQIDWFKRQAFATGRSEKISYPDHPEFDLGDERNDDSSDETETITVERKKKKRKPQASQEDTYEHLPVEETEVIVDDQVNPIPMPLKKSKKKRPLKSSSKLHTFTKKRSFVQCTEKLKTKRLL